ncbi:MAG: hypothetical protein J6B75_06920 [Ruminococcus sp.]|nr:hypothetical protein [Ruminococcus sp.]
MSLVRRITSAVLSVSLGLLSISSVPCSAVEKDYTYDNTFSEKSKDPASVTEKPFNVFDIYNAYYGIVPTTTAATTTATTTVTTTTVSTKKTTTTSTTATKKTTSATVLTTSTELTTSEKPVTTAIPTTPITSAPITAPVTTPTSSSSAVSTAPVTTATALCLNGIDVAKYQLDVDWQTAKASGEVDYAIIQAGFGKFSNQVDPYFHKNMQNAQAAGMDVGIYWFSYAKSVEDAKLEAQACLEVIKGYSFTYPIYYDFEYEWALKNLSVAELSAMVDAFCTIMEENGYYVGVYGSGSYLENSIYKHVLSKYDVWVAEYGSSVSWYKGQYGMWQYTGSGTAPGVPTEVDKDYCYKDYPSIIGVNPKDGRLPVTSTPVVTQPVVTDTQTTQQTTTASTTSTIATTIPRGYIIEDTSVTYDWDKFDKDKYQYAMLEVDSVQELDAVKANIDAAHAEGIDCGIIYLAVETSSGTASQNAEKLYNMLSTVKLEYPVYYWFNKSDISDYGVGAAQLSENADAFCSYLEERRYFVGIAAYDTLLAEQLDVGLFKKYSVWLFNEQETPVIYWGHCGMVSEWDYAVGGYSHYSKDKFPSIIAKNGLNGYPKTIE